METFAGKVAVVTGAGSGIGRGLALRLAAEGMRVVAADIDAARASETAALAPDLLDAQRVDVTSLDSMRVFADGVFERHGQVDVLCNNAGVFVGGFLWDRTDDEFQHVFGVNLWGILNGIRAFVPRMIAQDTDGHIVNTVSVAGLFGSAFSGPYNISKFAAFAATETLAGELLATKSKLRASALCPGIIATDIVNAEAKRLADTGTETGDQQFVMSTMSDIVPTGMDPAEVAGAVLDGIRADRFLILTHPHHAAHLPSRAEQLAAGMLPTSVDYR